MMQDLRFAARQFRKSPGFTAISVLSLALGIGANTAIFSILHALVLRSLPVADPQRLVVVTRNENVSSPYPLFTGLRDHANTLEGVLAFRTASLRLSTGGETEQVTGALVSGSYFAVLGVRPSAGTVIAPEDDQTPGSGGWRGPVAVLSHRFWMRAFGGRTSVVGTRILLNGYPFTVAGVAAPGFSGTEVGESPDVFAPMTMQQALLPGLGDALVQPRSQWLRIFARLKPGVSRQQSEAELTALLHRYNEANWLGGGNPDGALRRRLMEQKIVLLPGATGISQLRGEYAKPLWVLISVAVLVLLIACANVASLLLSRATARRREIAIRLSLGAARSRLIGQLFTESLLLAVAGVVSGLMLAVWMRDILTGYLPVNRTLNAPIDPAILAFTLLTGTGAALVFGLAPAFGGTSVDTAAAMKGGDSAGVPARVLLRKGLVILQVSLSCVLLTGAALFLRSLHNLLTVDPGFTRENILVASVQGTAGLDARILGMVKQLPGVAAAALADSPPLETHTNWSIYAPGYAASESGESPAVGFVSPGYFATMGIPLLLGRDMDERDVSGKRNVMLVNETFARSFFHGENPIGRSIGTKAGVYEWEIIGVVKDSKYTGLREDAVRMMYVPARPGPSASRTVVHIRFAGNPAGLAAALRQKVRELDPTAALSDVHTVQEEVERSLLRERLVGTIMALFGGLALVLVMVGLYGLIAYGVARRTREFGVRLAVGARPAGIGRLVVMEACRLLLAGTAIGLVAAWALGRVVKSMLFGITPADPASLIVAAGVLGLAALLAAWIPARRASRTDPMVALRYE